MGDGSPNRRLDRLVDSIPLLIADDPNNGDPRFVCIVQAPHLEAFAHRAFALKVNFFKGCIHDCHAEARRRVGFSEKAAAKQGRQ